MGQSPDGSSILYFNHQFYYLDCEQVWERISFSLKYVFEQVYLNQLRAHAAVCEGLKNKVKEAAAKLQIQNPHV